MPFFRSFVVATGQFSTHHRTSSSLVVEVRSPGSPARRHDQHVLDTDAPLAGQVHTRLDGDRNPIGQFTRSSVPQHRRLVDLQAHAVAQPVLEVLGVAGRRDQVPRRRVHVPDVRPDGQRLDPGPLRLRDQVVDVPLPAGGSPTAMVRVMSAWYPPYWAPKSIVTRSPRRSGRSVGEWCGMAPFGPLATMVSNAGRSAPSCAMR